MNHSTTYPEFVWRCWAPGCLPSLSSSSEGPAGAPPPPHSGSFFFSATPLLGGAGVSLYPGVQSSWRCLSRPQHTNVSFLQHILFFFFTSISFSTMMADFLFSPLWSCKKNVWISGRFMINRTKQEPGQLTVHGPSSSCEQSQKNERLLRSKKTFVYKIYFDWVCTPAFCWQASKQCLSWFSPSFRWLRLTWCQALVDEMLDTETHTSLGRFLLHVGQGCPNSGRWAKCGSPSNFNWPASKTRVTFFSKKKTINLILRWFMLNSSKACAIGAGYKHYTTLEWELLLRNFN